MLQISLLNDINVERKNESTCHMKDLKKELRTGMKIRDEL